MKKNAQTPQCIGIILDGNRRWAKERGLPTLEGHRKGHEKFKEVVRWAKERGIRHIIFYAFSTENWKRSEEEVGYLMDLFRTAVRNELDEIRKENVRVRFVGQVERLASDLQELVRSTEERTAHNTEGTVVLAVSYGGRPEIVQAVNRAIASGEREVTEETFARFLWTADIPDPDLIIRTGGEMRLSNFLPWQSTYSELFFPKTYWPAFSKEEFDAIIDEYERRERRMGK